MTARTRQMTLPLVALLALAGCGTDENAKPSAAPASPPPAVRAEPVASATVARQTRAVGVLAPRDEVRLGFKTGGVVERVLVDAGDSVRKGQLLAELKRTEVDATLAQASEAADKARRDLERGRRLRADEVATEEQVENLTTAYNVALANQRAARFNADYARIEAPADGIVFDRLVEGGELVQAGQPVVIVGATGSGWVVRFGLADRDAVRVAMGAPASVAFDAYPGRVFDGRVTRIGAAADRYTGTFEIEVEIAANGARFVRGLVGKVTLPLAETPAVATEATVVPVSALVEADGSRATVFVLDRDRNIAQRRQVTIGPLLGDDVIVTAGLEVGEPVITDGATWLSDGSAVREITADQG
ncbi:MAG: efflux RND transporter periplasmic adaptor subunit [Steroidobacteraceae bacterium]